MKGVTLKPLRESQLISKRKSPSDTLRAEMKPAIRKKDKVERRKYLHFYMFYYFTLLMDVRK